MQTSQVHVHATPSLRLQLARWRSAQGQRLTDVRSTATRRTREAARRLPARVASAVGASLPHWIINTAVAALVLSLPIAATASSAMPATTTSPVIASVEVARAQTASRGGTISAGRAPVTIEAQGARAIREYTLGRSDTLGTLSSFYDVSPEAIAFANGITDPGNLEVGRTIRIPPGDGALYTVQEGETIAAVATRFKVPEKVIMEANRLYFEPEHFAPDKLIFVPGAELPGLVYIVAVPQPEKPTPIQRAFAPQPAAPRPVVVSDGASLGLPVSGRITQRYRAGHTGVDIAAPFNSIIVAAAAGKVSATGYVPVGGLRVCVRHAGGLETCYYHTNLVRVSPGQDVERGEPIAYIGLTGVTTGPHVHWEAKLNGAFVNPLDYVR